VGKRIAIIQGHPDPRGERFGHAAASAYANGAREAGHEIKSIDVARLDFELLRSKEEWENGTPADAILEAQRIVNWAEHLVIFYPLWMGAMPAILKAFLEQLFRPGFAIARPEKGKMWRKLLRGKSARVVVTMGMPVLVYRWYFGAHGLKNLKRNILGLCGVGPIKESLIGMIEGRGDAYRQKWLARLRKLGRAGR
jgi:putative NADPH-quinone reductase